MHKSGLVQTVPFAGPHQRRAVAAETDRRTTGSTAWAAIATAAGAWAFYWVGSSRAFSYDGAASVKNFIATPSDFDAFRKHVVFNNHPLLSFLEHLVFDATGSRSEMVMRVLPVTFAAATVGLMLWLLCRPFGLRAAWAGTLLLAVNPVFVGNVREVRGYGLLTLCAVGSTALLVANPTARRRSAYGLVVAAGAATHLYMLPVLFCHVVLIWRRGERLRDWSSAWACAVAVAVLVELPALGSVGARGHRFRPGFPLQLAYNLAGGNAAAAILTGVVLVLAGAACSRRPSVRGVVAAVGAAVAAVVAVLWLWAPDDLYVRMFVWLVPAVALAGAFVAGIRRRGAVLVLAAAIAMLVPQLGGLGTPELANRAVQQYVSAIRRPDDTVCGLGETQGLGPYTFPFTPVESPMRLQGCGIAFMLMPRATGTLLRVAARARFPFACQLRAHTPALVFSHRWLADRPTRRGGREPGCASRHRPGAHTNGSRPVALHAPT